MQHERIIDKLFIVTHHYLNPVWGDHPLCNKSEAYLVEVQQLTSAIYIISLLALGGGREFTEQFFVGFLRKWAIKHIIFIFKLRQLLQNNVSNQILE